MMKSRIAMLALLTLAPFAIAPLAAQRAEQTFTKTIYLHDRLDLAIVSGAGTVQINEGPAGVLRITGHVKANDWHATDDRLRDIAARPPIQQNRNIIRVGSTEELAHVIIDYEIEAPADSIIQATSSVGDIFDDGVGLSARFTTGSGSIHAAGLRGSVEVSSKEGDIDVEQIGRGEVKAVSGTGNLELHDLQGPLHAATDTGSIKVSGVPGADWSVRTARGDVELTLAGAACTIDAQTGAGRVHSELTIEGGDGTDPRHLKGTINGGGHNVSVQVGEGEIRLL
jgi:Putative adhesin